MKVKGFINPEKPDQIIGYSFFCPGCKDHHVIYTNYTDHPNWKFNGDIEKPTFEPSLMVRGTISMTDEEVSRVMCGERVVPVPFVCHSFIRDGEIQFLGDCTHDLRNKTVSLININKK